MDSALTGALVSAIIVAVLGLAVTMIAWRAQHGVERRETADGARDTEISKLNEKVNAAIVQLAVLIADSKNNGGSSSRDALDRIERDGKETTRQIERLNDKIDGHLLEAAGGVARFNDHLAAHALQTHAQP